MFPAWLERLASHLITLIMRTFPCQHSSSHACAHTDLWAACRPCSYGFSHKNLINGFLETLSASLSREGILYICICARHNYQQGWGSWQCVFFLNGKRSLERSTRLQNAHLHYHAFFQGWEAGESEDRERWKYKDTFNCFHNAMACFVSLIWQHSNRLEIVVFHVLLLEKCMVMEMCMVMGHSPMKTKFNADIGCVISLKWSHGQIVFHYRIQVGCFLICPPQAQKPSVR